MAMTDRKMRVAILGTAWPLRGGLAAYNERLAKEYVQQGHEVIVFGFSMQYPGFLFPGKSQYSTSPAPEGITIRTIVNSVNPLNWVRTARAIRRYNPDLLIIKYWLPFMAPCLGTIAKLVRHKRKVRVVSVVDNMIPHERRPGDTLFSKYFVKQVDGFVAMSESVLRDIGTFDRDKPKKLCMHPLYDHFGEIRPKADACEALDIDPDIPYILFFGLIRDYKGLDILLRAMVQPDVKELGVKLIVAGEFYSDPTQYLHMIEVLNIQDRVLLHEGFIPDDKVAHYFNCSDLVVQPYKSATQSGVTQIAYHFHKPMIVTNVGGLPEMVPHGVAGYVTEPAAEQVAEAIIDFYTQHRGPAMSEAVAKEKLKYSWNAMTGAIAEVALRKV
jgi:D-inositol-3-phosphate glycosyltransferase